MLCTQIHRSTHLTPRKVKWAISTYVCTSFYSLFYGLVTFDLVYGLFYGTASLSSAVIHNSNSVTKLSSIKMKRYDYLKFITSNAVQVSFYTGACEGIDLQLSNTAGTLTPGPGCVVFQPPGSRLAINVTSAEATNSTCIATLANVSNNTHFRACITDSTEHGFIFDQPMYLHIDPWVNFNYTITADVLFGSTSDFIPGCSITPNEDSCETTKQPEPGDVCVYGLSSSDNIVISGHHIIYYHYIKYIFLALAVCLFMPHTYTCTLLFKHNLL